MDADLYKSNYQALKAEVHKVIVGHDAVVDQVLTAILAGGHVLLEGVPGLGKTLLCQSLATCMGLDDKRIQFTPDLMPADILGTRVVSEGSDGRKYFEFQPGPIFANIVLADEINRATPKTQSALLEAMQEGQVTLGERRPLPDPFFVLATQNPIDMEGTYPLPEAQLDRFMFKVDVPHQDLEALIEILDRTTRPHEAEVSVILDATILKAMRSLAREVLVSRSMLRYAAQLCQATHPDSPSATDQARRFVRFGSSPRGAQAIVRAAKARALSFGRPHVDPEDIRACATPALRHRVLLNFEGEAEGATSDQIVAGIVAAISDTDPETRALLSA